MCHYPENLRLVEKQNEEATTQDSSATRDVLDATLLYNPVFSSADEFDVLLIFETEVAHTRDRKPTATFNSHAFYFHVAPFLQKLRSMRTPACKQHPLSANEHLLTKILQTKTFWPAVKKMYSNTMTYFFYDPADKIEALAARAKSRTQHVFCVAKKNFKLGEETISSAQISEKSRVRSTSEDSRQPRKRASTWPSWLELRLALRTHRTRRDSLATI